MKTVAARQAQLRNNYSQRVAIQYVRQKHPAVWDKIRALALKKFPHGIRKNENTEISRVVSSL